MKRIIADFNNQTIYLWRSLILLPILILAYISLAENSCAQVKKKFFGIIKNVWLMLYLFSLSFLMIITVLNRGQTKPLEIISKNMFIFSKNGIKSDPLENMLLFIPYTFFYLQAFKPKKPWKSALIMSGITTFSIEGLQLIFKAGYFQLSDILHNMLGGFIGCGLWLLLSFIFKKLKKFSKIE